VECLKGLDFVVISHRYVDHTSGLNYLLRVNPGVKIYVPKETYGVFGSSLPGTFYRRTESLAPDMRYFGGEPPETIRHGTAWTSANFVYVDSLAEVAPGHCQLK
jgi:7,8-dihydropterin-6-yl-methyl-4-(beta-D-ribofuranosyl)aminobenzene 5'-phosphate synthase